jgi:hypothetical protein
MSVAVDTFLKRLSGDEQSAYFMTIKLSCHPLSGIRLGKALSRCAIAAVEPMEL